MSTNQKRTPVIVGSQPMSVVVIGLGHRSLEGHIPAILASDMLSLVGVVDSDPERARKIGVELNVPFASSVDDYLQVTDAPPETAIVAVPHCAYLPIVTSLASLGVHVIKEKPFAVSVEEARQLKKIVESTGISLHLTLQRRFDPVYLNFAQLVRRIGRVHAIEARYTMNITRLDEGWRANRLLSGGGALMDLGYHYVDLVLWYFGLPDLVHCYCTGNNRLGQQYDTEDTAFVQFAYRATGDGTDTVGSLVVSRVYPENEESLTGHGTTGSASVSRDQCQRSNPDGLIRERLSRERAWSSALVDQLEQFAIAIRTGRLRGRVPPVYLEHVAFIDAAYQSASTGLLIDPRESMRAMEE
jgi:predicted dehydrogenase